LHEKERDSYFSELSFSSKIEIENTMTKGLSITSCESENLWLERLNNNAKNKDEPSIGR
jgi:hypothetical protein